MKHLRLIDDVGMSLPIPSHWLDSLPDLMSLDLDHLNVTGVFLLPQHVVQIARLLRLRYLDAVVYPHAEVGDEGWDWDDESGSDSGQVDGAGADGHGGGENGKERSVPDLQVPVHFAHTLAHPTIDNLTIPSPSWNRLRGSIDLPALANLVIVTPTHHRAESATLAGPEIRPCVHGPAHDHAKYGGVSATVEAKVLSEVRTAGE
ncbi:hypothetical protein AMAG_16863 [Allomyces macrogynus ATCC 38327]|uniref:Uncharacterized protein n=1 Tax=Allomyces macrogynus (strain ATCC 38327) TaxID=578462 RepID=A0A0L0TC40_ALLM3|nr:hypothetical protein AMAG_16863 [Allomyces macrogynus ATCC 38327]|eukprot:KNE72378.1 hypothetical protein AMAG_16863 [Allomyces macrogynus ATCC 38327]